MVWVGCQRGAPDGTMGVLHHIARLFLVSISVASSFVQSTERCNDHDVGPWTLSPHTLQIVVFVNSASSVILFKPHPLSERVRGLKEIIPPPLPVLYMPYILVYRELDQHSCNPSKSLLFFFGCYSRPHGFQRRNTSDILEKRTG